MDDGQGGGKPHGNPYPKRGDIKKRIIKDWTGGNGSGNDGGNGGGNDSTSGGGGGGSAASGYYGAD